MLDSPDVASLTLAKHPFKTLYYFSCSIASGTASAAHFVATHPVTLGVALPILLLYAAAKGLGLYVDATGTLEVRVLVTCMPVQQFLAGPIQHAGAHAAAPLALQVHAPRFFASVLVAIQQHVRL
jgi:hypothetical protein